MFFKYKSLNLDYGPIENKISFKKTQVTKNGNERKTPKKSIFNWLLSH